MRKCTQFPRYPATRYSQHGTYCLRSRCSTAELSRRSVMHLTLSPSNPDINHHRGGAYDNEFLPCLPPTVVPLGPRRPHAARGGGRGNSRAGPTALEQPANTTGPAPDSLSDRAEAAGRRPLCSRACRPSRAVEVASELLRALSRVYDVCGPAPARKGHSRSRATGRKRLLAAPSHSFFDGSLSNTPPGQRPVDQRGSDPLGDASSVPPR